MRFAMRRIGIVGGCAVALLACALFFAVSGASAATCSSSGGFTSCKYWDGYMPATQNGLPFEAASGSNYWYTNRMWRPINHWASVFWVTDRGIVQGYVSNYGNNPFATKGSWGYDAGWCENDSGGAFSTATCQVYNWNA
jgi:hypothetical protein